MKSFPAPLHIPSITMSCALLALSLMTGCQSPPAGEASSESEAESMTGAKAVPFPAPAWQLKDMDGKVVRSSDFAGKVVILDFWATWCQPCMQEIPDFVKLQEKYKAQGLSIIGVDTDQGEDAAGVKKVVKELGINYTIVGSSAELEAALGGVPAIPATFIIDQSGTVVKQHVGFTPALVFEAEIRPLLADERP